MTADMGGDADLRTNRNNIESTHRSPDSEISSARRHLETALARYGTMLTGTTVGQITVDVSTVIVEATPEAAQIIGTAQEVLVGREIVEFIDPGQQDEILSYLSAVRNGIADGPIIARFAGPDRKTAIATVYASGVTNGSAATSFLHLTLFDVSHQQQIEDELRVVRDEMERHEQFERHVGWYQDKLRSVASQLTLTEERERRRIATDLHDRISQNLASANMKLGVLLDGLLSADQTHQIGVVREGIRDVIRNTRDLIAELSPPVLHEQPFETAIEWIGEHFSRRYGLKVSISGAADDSLLPQDGRVVLFRGVQELLTNCNKHAHASRIVVKLRQEEDLLTITVSDDGVGFDPQNREKLKGIGLFLLRERLEALGGTIHIDSSVGSGTRVTIGVPEAPVPSGPTESTPGIATGPDTTSKWRS